MPIESGSFSPVLKAKPLRRVVSIWSDKALLDRRLPLSGDGRGVAQTLSRTGTGRNDRMASPEAPHSTGAGSKSVIRYRSECVLSLFAAYAAM
jgi:hypothetical protein